LFDISVHYQLSLRLEILPQGARPSIRDLLNRHSGVLISRDFGFTIMGRPFGSPHIGITGETNPEERINSNADKNTGKGTFVPLPAA
jgi:hypothetical protein